MASKTPGVLINTLIQENVAIPAELNNAAFITRRGHLPNTLTLGLLNDVPLYTRYQIPGQYLTDPLGLLNFFKNEIGATVEQGITNTITLVAPDAATVIDVNGTMYTQLTWNTEPAGWTDLSGITISGTATQGANTGTIFNVSTAAFVILLSNVSGTFTTASPIVFDYTNLSVTLPNGLETERFVLDAYYASAAITGLQSTLNVTVTTPTIDLYIMSERDGLFNPVNTVTSLGSPDDVIDNLDGTFTLAWDTAPANWLYVPQSKTGTTLIQDNAAPTTNFGTFLEQLGPQYTTSGTGVSMLIGDVTGTITALLTLDMVLDDTFSVLENVKQNYYKFVAVDTADEPLTLAEQITTAAPATGPVLFPFTQFLAEVNAATAVQQNLFGTIGAVGATTLTVQELLNFGEVDNQDYTVPFYYYDQKFGDVYIEDGQLTCAYTALLAANEVPYPNLDGFAINGFPVSSDPSSYISVGFGQDSDTILAIGLTPIAVNQLLQPYIVRPVTTQLTIPGTGQPDEEFFDMHVQQVIWELKARTFVVSQLPAFQNALINATLINELTVAVEAMLQVAQVERMIFDVAATSIPSILIVQDGTNPQQLNITYKVKVTQPLEIQNYNETIISSISTTTLTTSVTLGQQAL